MDTRLANTWRLTVNEKKFIETAVVTGLRTDGRNPYEYRKLSIKFGRQVLVHSVSCDVVHMFALLSGGNVYPCES